MKHIKTRRGLTLVELLVVIAIILVIIALSFALLQRTMWSLEDAKVTRELNLLDQACEQFKATFNHFPPGRILLCEDMRGYRAAINDHICQSQQQLDPEHQRALAYMASISMEYLQSIFPGIDLNAGHDWNGDGKIDDRQYFLSGNEALVYFLGGVRYTLPGMPTGPGAIDAKGSNRSPPRGFNTDKTNPTKPTTSQRLGPFFEFDASRIVYSVAKPGSGFNTVGAYSGGLDPVTGQPTMAAGTSIPSYWNVGCSTGVVGFPGEEFIGFFPRYLDVWRLPYVYFRARNGRTNNYCHLYCPWSYQINFNTSYVANYHCWFADNYYIEHPGTLPQPPTLPIALPGKRENPNDGTKSSLWLGIVPYIQNVENGVVTYHNANRFQIISPGRDRSLGTGGFYIKEPSQAELSKFLNFKYFQEENIPSNDEFRANHDNITNINFTRVVPRP